MSEFTVKAFNDNVARGILSGSKCKICGSLYLPPRQICPGCGSMSLEWFTFKGEGRLEAFTVNRAPSTNFKAKAPYVVGIVRLDEGPAISGFIDVDQFDSINIGQRMSFKPLKEGERVILGFKPL